MPRAISIFISAVLASIDPVAAQTTLSDAPARSQYFSPKQWDIQAAFERELNAVPEAQRLRAWHDLLASEPHVAGSEGDARVIRAIADAFQDMGLEVQVQEFWALLSEPVDARLEIVSTPAAHSPQTQTAPTASSSTSTTQPARRGVIALPITEDNLLNDPTLMHPGLTFGWNAYSGSGDVTAKIVYANYGTKEDFETLKAVGVDCTGAIILARYGGNYRGFKVKYAQQAGAAGLIIYTDPEDAGYRKGVPYPEGGWANDTCIQRGSINTLNQPGDPLTPGYFASENAERVNPAEVDLPHIPVQPIGYRAAQQIMMQMRGQPLPADLIETWQGGLPCAYRLTGGDDLRVRLMVEQVRAVKKTANVIGVLRGERDAASTVYIGSHHDAWGYGAGDPTSGTIVVMEAARAFAELACAGRRPQCSIAFCAWGAEEFGIIGSTEYCEQNRDELRANALAYINLDGAAMGPDFSAASDPLLKTLIEEVARKVPQARDAQKSVFDAWNKPRDRPMFNNLGGGSDHIGFYCHAGVPSCFLSSFGAPGTAYHSNYDNLAWYRQVVGDDYEPALMLARIVNLLAARLVNAPLPPLDPARIAPDVRAHLDAIKARAAALKHPFEAEALAANVDQLDAAAKAASEALARLHEAGRDIPPALAATLARKPWSSAWLVRWPAGLPPMQEGTRSESRDWFKNFFASPDPRSGYAASMLPMLREAVEQGDERPLAAAVDEYRWILQQMTATAEEIGLLAESATK